MVGPIKWPFPYLSAQFRGPIFYFFPSSHLTDVAGLRLYTLHHRFFDLYDHVARKGPFTMSFNQDVWLTFWLSTVELCILF